VPAILLGLGDEKDTTKKKDGEAESTTADPVAPTSPRGSADTAAPTPAATTATPSTASTEIAEETNTAAADKITLFLQHLNKCVNRDMIDAAAVEFCYIMSKANRQRVVKVRLRPTHHILELPN
jgi:regulator of nonsense transcripts 2